MWKTHTEKLTEKFVRPPSARPWFQEGQGDALLYYHLQEEGEAGVSVEHLHVTPPCDALVGQKEFNPKKLPFLEHFSIYKFRVF